jgi:Arabinose efflux permease
MSKENLSRLKTSAFYRLGLLSLPENTRKFIYTHFNFLLFVTIPGVFINTFFFRQDGSIATVSIYNGVTCLGCALVMQITSRISLKRTPVFVLRIGVVIYNIFYIVLLLLQGEAARYMLLLGAINGVAAGFYWQGYNEMVKLCTNEEIVDKTLSLIGLSNAVVTLVIPILSGFLISYCPDGLGYTIIFILSFLFSLYTTYLTTGLKNIKAKGKSNLPGIYRYIFSDRRILALQIGELVRGIKNTAFPLFLNIIFFKFVADEAALGVNTMLCGLASIVSFILASRLVKAENRFKYILGYSLISIVLFLPLFFVMNSAIIFLLAIVNAFVGAFIDNPSLGVLYSAFESRSEDRTFSQYMAAHEIFFAVGRWIGLILLIVLSGNMLLLAIFALLGNFSTVITAVLFRVFVRQPGTAADRAES